MEDQRKRDEQVMKEHQSEAARKGEMRLKAFYREQKQATRERIEEGGPSASSTAKGEMKDFESGYVQARG